MLTNQQRWRVTSSSLIVSEKIQVVLRDVWIEVALNSRVRGDFFFFLLHRGRVLQAIMAWGCDLYAAILGQQEREDGQFTPFLGSPVECVCVCVCVCVNVCVCVYIYIYAKEILINIFLYFSWVYTSNARYRLRREIRVPQGPLGPDVSRNPNCGLQYGKTGPPAQLSPA